MAKPPALIVSAGDPDDAFHLQLTDVVVRAIEENWDPDVVDLKALGFVPFMSAAERAAYHSNAPIVDPMVADHATLVGETEAIIFVFPTRWWQPPAVLKAWLERVFVPGVAFVFDENHRVRPNLGQLRAIAGVTTYNTTAWSRRWVGDGSRRMLLRAMRANVPHRVLTSWNGLDAVDSSTADERHEFVTAVGRRMARLRRSRS